MAQNPQGATAFFEQLRGALARGHRVFIDLSRVRTLGSDAVIVLLSRLNDPEFTEGGLSLGGNEPQDPAAKRLLTQSGFYTFVRSSVLRDPPIDGLIRRRQSVLVEPEVGDELIQFATTRLFGAPKTRRAIQRAFVECMANTHEHSSLARSG